MLEQSPGGSPNQQDLADFLRRYQEDPNSISAEEAARRYRELIQLATPADAAEAHSQVFAGLPPEDRRTLAQQFQRAHSDPNSAFDGYQYDDQDQAAAPRSLGLMARQAGQQDGGLLGSLLGEGSPLNSTLGKLALAGVAAYLARRVLGGHNQQPGAQGAGGLDIGSILSALSAAQNAQGGEQGAKTPDLSALLGDSGNAQGGKTAGGPDLSGLFSEGDQPKKDG
jgi:hypothetical protein